MPSIFEKKDTAAPSVFQAAALLREARRQKGLAAGDVPRVCVLDPDGDIVRQLESSGRATRAETWACYHTTLHLFSLASETVGIVGCAVGAPFAVLVAEEMFASGCRLLVSVTSAGQIGDGAPPYYVIIDRAMRDEGTSHHYLPPSEYSVANPQLVQQAATALQRAGMRALVGASWTTDAPFRETADAIASARAKGALAVEMEAAALYAFGRATGNDVLCLAHVTNTMAQAGDDFEKGEEQGTVTSLRILETLVAAFR